MLDCPSFRDEILGKIARYFPATTEAGNQAPIIGAELCRDHYEGTFFFFFLEVDIYNCDKK
jgi:hypothetical protein